LGRSSRRASQSKPRGYFPATRKSAVFGAGSDDAAVRARAFDVLVRAYYRPVYKHVRVRWRKDAAAAQDLTQAVFAAAFEEKYFTRYDAAKAHFRSFLKTILDRFVMKEERARKRIKRGGHVAVLSLDFESAEAELARAMPASWTAAHAEACFDQEWARVLMS